MHDDPVFAHLGAKVRRWGGRRNRHRVHLIRELGDPAPPIQQTQGEVTDLRIVGRAFDEDRRSTSWVRSQARALEAFKQLQLARWELGPTTLAMELYGRDALCRDRKNKLDSIGYLNESQVAG